MANVALLRDSLRDLHLGYFARLAKKAAFFPRPKGGNPLWKHDHRPEVRAFLTEGTRIGEIAYASADGRSLVLPVWFVPEGDALVPEEPGGG